MTKRLLSVCAATVALFLSQPVYAQTELIGNGGFENGPGNPAPWVIEDSEVYGDSGNGTTYAHSGNYVLWLGGLESWTDDAYQTVTIPSGMASATLSFYYLVNSLDDPDTAYDYLSASLVDTNGNTLEVLGVWSNVDADNGVGPSYYHQLTHDMLPYAGQTVRLYFTSENDNLYPTSLFVDDVSLTTTPPVGPADLMPQNVSVSPNPALADGAVMVNYRVANIGGAAAPASHTTVVIKDSANNVFAQQTFATAALGIGGTTNESHSMGLTGAATGNYNVYVTVDANNEAGQTNTVNDTTVVPLTVVVSAGLIINPIYDSSITSDPNSATIQNTINAAIQQYEALFSDPITVTIQFSKMSSGLGQSLTYIGSVPYSDFLTALKADARTTNDSIALAHLPGGTVNPVNGDTDVMLTTANLRALGMDGDTGGAPDSTISLNLSLMNLSRSSIDPNKYDLMAVAQHEIDEALTMGSSLNGLANGDPTPTGPVHIMDLFRYDQNHARSFNTTESAEAYFSIDGITNLVRFNQTEGGDFQDWYSPGGQTPRVQDAVGTPGATPNLGVELIALDASGYNLVSAVPAPKVVSTSKSGNTVTVTWTSQPNLNYQLQYKTNVTQVGWLNLGSAITATGSTASASDTISATQRYYRVASVASSSSIVHKNALAKPTLSTVTTYLRPAHGL